MPDAKISELTPAVVINDADLIVIVQDGGNYNAPVGMVTGGIKRARVEVSSAEILALNSSPVELIAAPGAGKMTDVISGKVYYTFSNSHYRSSDDGFVQCGGEEIFLNQIMLGQNNNFVVNVLPSDNDWDFSSFDNAPVVLTAHSDPEVTGGIATASVNFGGANYEVGDTGTIDAGATYLVTAVEAGAVTAFEIVDPGVGYYPGEGFGSTADTGVGVSFAINIDSISNPSAGTLVIDLLYRIVDLP